MRKSRIEIKKLYKWMSTVKRKGEDIHIYIYKV